MKKLVSIFLLFAAIGANAQHGEMMGHMPMITRSIGINFQEFDGINARVANLPQYKQLRDNIGSIGLGWMKEHKRVVTNGGIQVGSSLSGHRDEKSSAIRLAGISGDIGYDVLKSEKLLLYPFAGLGLQGYQAIFYKDNRAVNFNDVLQSTNVQNNIEPVKFTNGFFVYRLGLGFSVKSTKYPTHSIGLQAGYTGSFKSNDWKSKDNQTLATAPVDKISMFYVGLVLTDRPMFRR